MRKQLSSFLSNFGKFGTSQNVANILKTFKNNLSVPEVYIFFFYDDDDHDPVVLAVGVQS